MGQVPTTGPNPALKERQADRMEAPLQSLVARLAGWSRREPHALLRSLPLLSIRKSAAFHHPNALGFPSASSPYTCEPLPSVLALRQSNTSSASAHTHAFQPPSLPAQSRHEYDPALRLS